MKPQVGSGVHRSPHAAVHTGSVLGLRLRRIFRSELRTATTTVCSPPSEDAGRRGYSLIMSSAERQSEVLDLVVGADGSGSVDAAQLARLGVEPGTHLSVVPISPPRAAERRRSVRGALAGSGPCAE